MGTQPEAVLESQLVAKLESLGYAKVRIPNEEALLKNLKAQLEKHNGVSFTDLEFERVTNLLEKGSIFEKAKTLREKQHIQRDNGDNLYFEFLNVEHWCQNEYQVTQQVTVKGKYENRYDVTLLVNGLPLVQIELKRRGLEIKEAFNQIRRYQAHSFGENAALFQYIQLFIVSNGVNTKYFANNRVLDFKQTFFWGDADNNKQTNILNGFASAFLEPCHLSKMICKYIVLNETQKALMVLRPYQFYAVESMIDRVKNSTENGYIWHTTGSGKTLTSFKASQIISRMPQVKKVVFVVDRKDLDYQTIKEFNSFSKGSIDGTDNTKTLVKQFAGDARIIVTTIQKLNTAISKKKYLAQMEAIKDKRIVFIFDECHRSQFGETHERIKNFFTNHQMFGFTGTPIFEKNAVANELGKRTTKMLFGACLHKYVITDAIKDQNVLRFSVEYVGRYKQKETATEIDIEVEDIDRKELMESEQRLEKIVDYILANHDRKTQSRDFTAMFCVGSTDMLVKYYELFHKKKVEGKHSLKIATIFSYGANEDMGEPVAFGGEGNEVQNQHKRDKLEQYIGHYNAMFKSNFTTKDSQSFYNYYNDISKRVKNKEIDILLVVNMFLTGFDSKLLNTLYVDKGLKHHGLIQAYSRTNRIYGERKSQGNIVVFRNLKEATDEAIALFSNKNAKETIILEPYEKHASNFNEALEELIKVAPTVDSVNDLQSEEDELAFVQAFRKLMRAKNVLESFSDFSWEDLEIDEQDFNDYASKYIDLRDKVKQGKEKVSILDDVDFELELIQRDEINVSYILSLLASLAGAKKEGKPDKRNEIMEALKNGVKLRSKRELIEKFIDENLPKIDSGEEVSEQFDKFWDEEKSKAFQALVQEENLSPERTQQLIKRYLPFEQKPQRDDLLKLREGKMPSVLKREAIGNRLWDKILGFVETFFDGMH